MEVGHIYRSYPEYNFKSVSVNKIARRTIPAKTTSFWNKNISLIIAYVAVAVLWFSLGITLSSVLQLEPSILFWSGWTIVFGWSAGLVFFAVVSIFHLKSNSQQTLL